MEDTRKDQSEKLEDRSNWREPLEQEETRLQGLLNKVRGKIDAIRKAQKEREWLATDEGRRWTKLEKSRVEVEAQANARTLAVLNRRYLEGRRALATQLLADSYLAKYPISDDDPRLFEIRREQQKISDCVDGHMYGGR